MTDNNPLDDSLNKHPLFADAVKNHPLGDLNKDYPHGEIKRIGESIASGASHFNESQVEALHVVVRLTVEFFYYLQRGNISLSDYESLSHVDESIFSGLDSFCLLSQAYRTTAGETRSALAERVVSSGTALAATFLAMYRDFADESNFERKCRLLLDLFKLQIIFAGLTYD